MECGKLTTTAGTVGYCINPSDRAQNPDVLYYFHAASTLDATDLEKPWQYGDPGLIEHWHAMQIARPTIISISWGPRWFLKDDKLSALEFEIIPELEGKLRGGKAGRRLVLGASMGGFNAFLAWSQLPHLFDAAAFQCPAFTQFFPGASLVTRMRYAQKHPHQDVKLNTDVENVLAAIFRPFFRSTSDWLQYQPPMVMDRLAGRKLPPAYLVYNTHDQFGLRRGSEIGAAGKQITYEDVNGGHCEGVSTKGLAQFLSSHRLLRPDVAGAEQAKSP